MTVSPHEHAVSLDDAFDFINTLEYDERAPVDHLSTPTDAIGWLVDHRLLHPEPAAHLLERHGSSTGLLDRIRSVRAALRGVIDALVAERPGEPWALERVNEVLRAREVVVLEPADEGVRVGHRHEGDPVDDALARIAGALVHEVASGHPDRLRVCAADDCRWAFYDASPAGRRRWCSMASCGNRAKAARHRARQKESAPPVV